MEEKIVTNYILSTLVNLINNQIAPPYSMVSAYRVGDLVNYGGVLYKCIEDIPAPSAYSYRAWQPEKWIATKVSDYFWFGTAEQYQSQSANIKTGTIIIITDDGAPVAE